jgi:hypothetical protein
MKYLKTFEKHITIELDDNDQVYLMSEYIREYDRTDLIEKKSILSKIKNLFKNGFDPNINFVDSSIPFVFILERLTRYYNEILEVFVKYGLSGNIAKKILESDSIHWLNRDNLNFIKKLKILIETDVNLLEKIESSIPRYNGLNILEVIEDKLRTDRISKEKSDRIFDIIKNKKPEQYQQYLIQKNANKYNL